MNFIPMLLSHQHIVYSRNIDVWIAKTKHAYARQESWDQSSVDKNWKNFLFPQKNNWKGKLSSISLWCFYAGVLLFKKQKLAM